MKTHKLFIVIGFMVSSMAGHAQTIAPSYEVGTWQGFRTAAVSYTFDDACPNQFSIAIPMFNEFGFQLTLFTPTGTSWLPAPNWSVLNNAASQGHEIASHGITHTTFTGMSDSVQTMELRDSQADINTHIPGGQCITFAYPYCNLGKKSIVEKYYIAARTCSGSIAPKSPSDFTNISSIVCGTEGSLKTTANFISRFGSVVTSKGWCVFLLHGINTESDGWSPVESTVLRETLEYLAANPNDYWVTSFGNVARYIKERNAASVAETSAGDSSITAQVTDALPDSIYNYPITLRRPLPEGWISATVTQNGFPVESRIVEIDAVKQVQFDAVPDGGEVVITKSNATRVESRQSQMILGPKSAQNYPNPFNPTTTIEFSLPERSDVNLVLLNASGQVVKELAAGSYAAGSHQVQLDASALAGGVYFYQLHAGNRIDVKKLVVTK